MNISTILVKQTIHLANIITLDSEDMEEVWTSQVKYCGYKVLAELRYSPCDNCV